MGAVHEFKMIYSHVIFLKRYTLSHDWNMSIVFVVEIEMFQCGPVTEQSSQKEQVLSP